MLAAGLFWASPHSPVSGNGAGECGDTEPRLPQVINGLKIEDFSMNAVNVSVPAESCVQGLAQLRGQTFAV